MLELSRISNEFIHAYLEYTENTEPPKLFHIWSAIGAASAGMGRHVWLPFGAGDIYPNQYILLVGPPGTRKNTAINFATKLLKKATSIKLAPDDTAGQRQGLIAAMVEAPELVSIEDQELMAAAESLSVDMLNGLSLQETRHEDLHTMFIIASEFGSFLGQNNLELTRFLIKMWDGEPYTYGLANERKIIKDPLLTMLGGTTSTDMATLLPPEAMGQGFMSRIILVWAAKKEKLISRPSLKTDDKKYLISTYKFLAEEMYGPMEETPAATRLVDELYHRPIDIPDTRFLYYAERRHTHFLKLLMCLAALRRSNTIEPRDVEEADMILAATETTMPDALGEYGLSPLAIAKQKMVEFLQHAGQPITDKVLWAFMSRDMKLLDFRNSLATLVNAKKIVEVSTNQGKAYVYKDTNQEVLDLLAKEEPPQEAPVVPLNQWRMQE